MRLLQMTLPKSRANSAHAPSFERFNHPSVRAQFASEHALVNVWPILAQTTKGSSG